MTTGSQPAADIIDFDQAIELELVEVISPDLTESMVGAPVSVAPQPRGNLFILGREPSQIVHLDTLREPVKAAQVTGGVQPMALVNPRVIRLGVGLAILVADANRNVFVYDYNLRLVDTIEPSEDATDFPTNSPQGLAVSRYGEIFIVDGDNEVIYEYDAGGKYVTVLGESDFGILRLTRPTGIDVCADGRLVVCDTGMRRAVLISEVGDILESYEDTDLWEPVAVAVTPDQKAVFIGDRQTGQLWLFSIDGYLQQNWGASELTPNGITGITDLQLRGDMLYLVDTPGEQVCRFQITQRQ